MSEQPTKYGNKKITIDGITFDSKKEAARYRELKLLKQAGHIIDFKLQPKFPYLITYSRQDFPGVFKRKAFYKADFEVIYADRTVIEDVKGCKTAIYKRKKKIIETLYNIQIVEK